MRRTLARLEGRPVSPTNRDPFLEAAGIPAGDAVLDATLGLGADALVAAAACGPGGRVVALERSPVLAAWVAEGLRRLDVEPARRIEVRAEEHLAALTALPSRSFNLVVFDPMFRHARAQPGGFELVRILADARPLGAEAVAQARRVARRWVVVKDGAPGWDLARLGLSPLPSARGAHRDDALRSRPGSGSGVRAGPFGGRVGEVGAGLGRRNSSGCGWASAKRSTSSMCLTGHDRAREHHSGHVVEVLLVLLGDQHALIPARCAASDLLLEPADGQHAAAQRDLAGHRHVLAHRDAASARPAPSPS